MNKTLEILLQFHYSPSRISFGDLCKLIISKSHAVFFKIQTQNRYHCVWACETSSMADYCLFMDRATIFTEQHPFQSIIINSKLVS